MQIYVGLGSDSEILVAEKKADVYAHAEVIYVCLAAAYCIRTAYLHIYCIECISWGVCSARALSKVYAEKNSIDIKYNFAQTYLQEKGQDQFH